MMKCSVESLKNRIYELNLRIDKELCNSNSRSELKKLEKQKAKLEKQLEKINR